MPIKSTDPLRIRIYLASAALRIVTIIYQSQIIRFISHGNGHKIRIIYVLRSSKIGNQPNPEYISDD